MTAPVAAAVGAPVRILYGTEMGDAQDLADEIVQELAGRGILATMAELDKQPIEELGEGIALIIVATYGEGDMPYTAEDFWEHLDGQGAPDCAGLRYAVLALGDSSYTYFCEAGVLIDDRLAELGATRLADRVDCDVDYEDIAHDWIAERLSQLDELFGEDAGGDTTTAVGEDTAKDASEPVAGQGDVAPGTLPTTTDPAPVPLSPPLVLDPVTPPPTASPTPVHAPPSVSATDRDDRGSARPAAPPWNREHPFAARLVAARRLSEVRGADGLRKTVWHYELDLQGSGIELLPGDSLAIVPVNDRYTVDRFLDSAHLSAHRLRRGHTLRFWATRRWELHFPSTSLLAEIATQAPHSALGAAVAGKDRAAVDDWVRGHGVADALRLLPSPLLPKRLAELMGPLRYRAYSVASSTNQHPEAVHLCLAAQELPAAASARMGAASAYLTGLPRPGGVTPGGVPSLPGGTGPGTVVQVFPVPNRSFRLPEDDSAPLIMVGPGVGVAPFRAFLQEREARQAAGPAWLFFGNRHAGGDFLYQEDWQGFLASGALSALDTAFSRDQADRVYVQDRLREHAAQIAAWLRDGAYLYVCGDAHRMAPDVDHAVRRILTDELGGDEGDAVFSRLRDERRYRRDVY